MKCESRNRQWSPWFIYNSSYSFKNLVFAKASWKKLLSLVFSPIPVLLIFVSPPDVHSTICFAVGRGWTKQIWREQWQFCSHFVPLPESDESVGRMCFSGLSGSRKPLHVASAASQRKPCVNGFFNSNDFLSPFSCPRNKASFPLFSFPPLKNAVDNRFLGGTFAPVVAAIFFQLQSSLLSAIFGKCNVFKC